MSFFWTQTTTECPEENNEERAKFHQVTDLNLSQTIDIHRNMGSSTPSIDVDLVQEAHRIVETEEREEEISFACDALETRWTILEESVEPPPSVEFLVDSGASDHLISR
ncbi:Hypothetical protein NTJ_13945 [Nesidiocoris tenuis]|uniref:Peptidase A2 domain-containing protein n=1 Tax=Nesidiocoris tenuis TaxID=355587 RepID=A0ABN7B9S4_9HEMI|nr:Hypothetical protein NTJ_13945 [Nesidiocoris tenuis]